MKNLIKRFLDKIGRRRRKGQVASDSSPVSERPAVSPRFPSPKGTVPSGLAVPEDNPWSPSQFQVPEVRGKVRFHDLGLPDEVMRAVFDLGFQYCTPIQAEILPSTLKGKDATGRAQTGTGKTAAFLITTMTHLLKNPLKGKTPAGAPRVLVLAPTRELALQITAEARQIGRYCPFSVLAVYGGMDYEKQRRRLDKPVDIVVATPGRLLDFHRQRGISLKKVEILVIDEADRMLDMGFIPDVRTIVYSTPAKDKRQTLFFSATLDDEVSRLAASWTRGAVKVEIEPEHVAVDTVKQEIFIVTREQKFGLLYNIIEKRKLAQVLVFCNRKDETRRLSDLLSRYGIQSEILSGDVPQKTRIRRLEEFKAGKIRVLVATDVAGRGIHIEGMDHVINFTLPYDPEDYVHRIGRTGRAGASGTSVSFADEEDSFHIPAIEEFIGESIPCVMPDEEWLVLPEPGPAPADRKRRGRGARPGRSQPSPKRDGKRPVQKRRRRPRPKKAGD